MNFVDSVHGAADYTGKASGQESADYANLKPQGVGAADYANIKPHGVGAADYANLKPQSVGAAGYANLIPQGVGAADHANLMPQGVGAADYANLMPQGVGAADNAAKAHGTGVADYGGSARGRGAANYKSTGATDSITAELQDRWAAYESTLLEAMQMEEDELTATAAGDGAAGNEEGGSGSWDVEGDETIAAISLPLAPPN
jgi:hypothetical protein